MKKSIFLVAFAVITTLGYAQTSPGSMMLGGGLTINSTSYQGGDANNSTSISFSPGFGYFVSENFAVGAELSIGSSRTGTGDNKDTETAFGFGPFARYYIFTSNEKFGFFGQAQLAFATFKEDPAVGGISKGSAIAFALAPGAAWFFNEHWALEFAVRGFSVTSTDPEKDIDDDKFTTVEFGLNTLQPSLGFRYHF